MTPSFLESRFLLNINGTKWGEVVVRDLKIYANRTRTLPTSHNRRNSESQKWNHVSKLTHFGGLSLWFHISFLPIIQDKGHDISAVCSQHQNGLCPPLPLQPFLFRRSAIQNSHFPNSWGKHKIHFTTGCSRHPSTTTAIRGHRNIIRKKWHKRIRCIVFIDNVKAEP